MRRWRATPRAAGSASKAKSRPAAQMRPAPDAQTIDTTDLTVDDVLDRIEQLVQARAGA